jgi:hypothetical protein
MEKDFHEYEKAVKVKHRVAWTPKYSETFRTSLSNPAFLGISIKACEKLGWEVVYKEDGLIEARRRNDWGQAGQKITMRYNYGEVEVKSVSLGNGFWDMGRNSK